MTSPALPRRVAAFLLQSAIFIAPHDTLDWGHAMLAELHHVQGNWAALLWSLGSAGVLAKHTLLSLIFPGRNRSTVPSGGGLLIKEGPVRKPALAVTAACVIASLLFFFAPVFRQAVRVSLLPWEFVFRTDHSRLSPELQRILKKAEKDRDADALAFVAFQHPEGTEAARLGDEAVRLDASLTWVYGIVAVRGSSFQLHRWVPRSKSLTHKMLCPTSSPLKKSKSSKSCTEMSRSDPKTSPPPGKTRWPLLSNPRSSTSIPVSVRRCIVAS
jgi:hypothetical protein